MKECRTGSRELVPADIGRLRSSLCLWGASRKLLDMFPLIMRSGKDRILDALSRLAVQD
jgi:hypothetical protein